MPLKYIVMVTGGAISQDLYQNESRPLLANPWESAQYGSDHKHVRNYTGSNYRTRLHGPMSYDVDNLEN